MYVQCIRSGDGWMVGQNLYEFIWFLNHCTATTRNYTVFVCSMVANTLWIHACMDGWLFVVGCMKTWWHGCTDGCMDGLIVACIGCMDWMHALFVVGCMEGEGDWMHGWLRGWIDGCLDWMHGCMDAWMHGFVRMW